MQTLVMCGNKALLMFAELIQTGWATTCVDSQSEVGDESGMFARVVLALICGLKHEI